MRSSVASHAQSPRLPGQRIAADSPLGRSNDLAVLSRSFRGGPPGSLAATLAGLAGSASCYGYRRNCTNRQCELRPAGRPSHVRAAVTKLCGGSEEWIMLTDLEFSRTLRPGLRKAPTRDFPPSQSNIIPKAGVRRELKSAPGRMPLELLPSYA